MRKLLVLAFILVNLLFAQSNLVVKLAVDSNRDGKVNFTEDDLFKNNWDRNTGAIFLYNNDSDENNGQPDCFDTKINGTDDLHDFAPIFLQKMPDLPETAKISLFVDTDSQSKINVFIHKDNEYLFINKTPFSIPVTMLKNNDITFYIEAKSYADYTWNGMTTITVEVETKTEKISDTVLLKVAPFILLPNTQEIHTIYIRAYPGKNDTMIQQLKTIMAKTSATLEIVPADLYPYNQIWMQDTMEIGYSQTPTHWLPVVLPANRNRSLDNWAETHLLGKNFGWFRYSNYRHEFARGGGENGWLDWYGNLEVSPAFEGYPLGRIYYGNNALHSLNPDIVSMLNHQNVQGPAVNLDTGWLLIKHVDEILSFIPTNNPEKPFKALVPSTKTTIQLLQKWQKEGKGNLKIVERNAKNWTIDSLLQNKNLIEYNEKLQQRIDAMYTTIKKEFALSEEDIIYIPALVSSGESLIPNMVNSVYFNGNLLMADPNGPRDENVDILQEYVKSLFLELPIQLHFLDDWKYHTWAGNVHCATNSRRQKFSSNWWDN